jgi:magnesium transporter
MVTIYQYIKQEVRRLSVKEFAAALHSDEGIFWVDLEDPNDAEEETIMVALLDLHPLAIEDCQKGKEEDGHLPKVEDLGEYLFVIFNPVESAPRGDNWEGPVEIRTTQLSAVLGRRLLLTHHYRFQPSLANTSTLLAKNPLILGKGPDFLFHMIIDDVVDRYNPILDALDEAVDELEERVFGSPGQDTMEMILRIKKSIMTIRRISVYQREMLYRLSRGEFNLITHDEMIYYRNVYDHLVRMTDLAESYRDMTAGLLDAYLSVTSNRLNQVMKVLTIISTIFLPLGVITGFFGMNFKYLPGAESEHGVLATAILMMLVGAGMLWVFKRNKWI